MLISAMIASVFLLIGFGCSDKEDLPSLAINQPKIPISGEVAESYWSKNAPSFRYLVGKPKPILDGPTPTPPPTYTPGTPTPTPTPPAREARCDGEDDPEDPDTIIDNGCCVCKAGAIANDVNGDNAWTDADAYCPLLISMQATTIPTNVSCMDKAAPFGTIDMNDVIALVPPKGNSL